MKSKGLDCVLITKKENYFYLSGFNGSSAVLLISQENAVLITDFRYKEQAQAQAAEYKIEISNNGLIKKLSEFLSAFDLVNVGFEDSQLSYKEYLDLTEKLSSCKLIPMGNIMQKLRIIKDEEEIGFIRKAMEIADKTFAHILGFIKPGVSEIELAAEMEYFMRKNGASGPSFDTIVASGQRSALPHGVASNKKLKIGDPITMDFGAIYNGYCSDMTRTVYLGEPDPLMKRIYRVTLEAQEEALESVKAGASGSEVDAVARNIISRYGFGSNFGHGLGHGVGLEVHEEPRLSVLSSNILEKGMVVTVEPGIYLDGIGGVRIEDMLVVNGDNPINLTQSTKEMIIL
jgi:Xaa-Pro aminopeptidase